MESDILASLSRPQREAVESAGYRVWRWAVARGVLQTRVFKRRILNELGEFLGHWLPQVAPRVDAGDLRLEFSLASDHLFLIGGSESLVASPIEQAALHLPALRSFWRQELRSRHFDALRAMVPKAWLLDDAVIPPGAVVQGLGLSSWKQPLHPNGSGWEVYDRRGRVRDDRCHALAARDGVLTSVLPADTKLNACYALNDKHRVVLRSVEASS